MKQAKTSGTKFLSIITVNYFSARKIEQLAKSLANQLRADTEWIIVDNSADKAELARLKQIKLAKIIDAGYNLGFGKANNLGAQTARGNYLFLLNPDTVVEPSTLVEIRNFVKQYPKAIIAPKIMNPDRTLQRSIHRRFPGILYHTLEYNPFLVILLEKILPDWHISLYSAQEHLKEQRPLHALGAAMILPHATFTELGGFDEDFFLYREETDLLQRAISHGHEIIYSPKIVVLHDAGSAGGNAILAQLDARYTVSAYQYLKKHQASWVWLAWILAVLGLLCSIIGFGILLLVTLGQKKSYRLALKKCVGCLGWHVRHPFGFGS